MKNSFTNSISSLLFVFFIAPYGFGISNFLFLNSLDLPKVVPVIIFVIVISKFNFRKIDLSILFFYILFILHFCSVFYSQNINKGLVDFLSNALLFYPGFFIPFLIIKSEYSLKRLIRMINFVVLFYISFSIIEFVFQVNFFDFIRNSYEEGENRFNNQLGFIRLGMKSSMGPFASTLPFAYTFVTLFFLKDLYVPDFLRKNYMISLVTVFAVIAIFFTLTRAAIFSLIFLLIYKNLINSKFRTKLSFIIISTIFIIILSSQIKETVFEKYISNYIVNIFDDQSVGVDSRTNNNLIDFNYALKSPFLGHGAGQLYLAKSNDGGLGSSDSSYLVTILADRGFLSLTVFAILFFITARRCYFLSKIKSKIFNFSSLGLSLFVLFLCINSSQRLEPLFLFYFLIGLINCIYLTRKNVDINSNTNLQ
tara:strand:+ start:105 stop:1373 length:1269 start_codon:yes stop_codon:yes gene_type:complete